MTLTITPRHFCLAWFAASAVAAPFAGTYTLAAALGISIGLSLLFAVAFYNLEYEWVRVEP